MLKVKASRNKEYITLPSKVMEKLALKSGDRVTVETRADEIVVKRRAKKAKANGATGRAAVSETDKEEPFDEWLKKIQATAVLPPPKLSKEEALAILKKHEGGWENLDIEGPLEEMRERFRAWKPLDWS
ncbi:MAG: AbrB/MazE/SpoVT family DNA-binding domain-containing protein [Chloroflexota bacterium]